MSGFWTAVVPLLLAGLIPLACLGLLLWMSWLEDTLPRDVDRTVRRREPPPVLHIPVQRPSPNPGPVPGPNPAPAAEPVPEPAPAIPVLGIDPQPG